MPWPGAGAASGLSHIISAQSQSRFQGKGKEFPFPRSLTKPGTPMRAALRRARFLWAQGPVPAEPHTTAASGANAEGTSKSRPDCASFWSSFAFL